MAIEDSQESRTAYGEELRRLREVAGLTQEELSQRTIMSRTHIAHIEAGRRKPSPDDAHRLDEALGTSGILERFLPTLDGRKVAKHFEAAAEFEQQAMMIREYAATLVPGMLQTEAYMRAVFRVSFPPKSEEGCDRAISTRLARGRLLADPLKPVLWCMLDEAAIRRPVGGPAVMAEQLRHIADLADCDRIRVHVLPYGVGAHALVESSLTLMWFEDLPPIAYVEGFGTGKVFDLPTTVHRAQASYEHALGDALGHQESLALIRTVAEEREREQQ